MRTDELNPKHFDLLRLAKLRGLKVRRLGEGVYAVTSFSRRRDGIEWAVSEGVCSCPSRAYCSHTAAAVDYFFTHESTTAQYDAYSEANSNDRLALRLRIRSGETTRNDRVYIRYSMKVYERKRAAVKFGIRQVEATAPNGKTKVREFVGTIQI